MVPKVNVVRLRGRLAEAQISQMKFAALAGISYWHFCQITAESVVPGDLSRSRIIFAARKLGWDDVVVMGETAEQTA